jgi:Flp pilus assembly protein CpaB
MATQMRQPRTRSGGGRTLMLLGVLLALAAGTIVIYVVSQAAGPAGGHTVTVVVAAQNLTPGSLLSATANDSAHVLVSTAFTTKQVNADFVPNGAYTYTDMSHLNIALNDMVIVGQFYGGDILRQNDPRLVPQGQAATGSMTLINPSQLPKGDVLFPMQVPNLGALGVVAGDHVDVLLTACVTSSGFGGSGSGSACTESQTTFQNLYVYAVARGLLFVVLSHQDALTMKWINDAGNSITLAIRAPGDTDPANTFPATGSYIYSHFHFAQP